MGQRNSPSHTTDSLGANYGHIYGTTMSCKIEQNQYEFSLNSTLTSNASLMSTAELFRFDGFSWIVVYKTL